MRNVDKYEKKLKEIGSDFAVPIESGKPVVCRGYTCLKCLFNMSDYNGPTCDKLRMKWLYEAYEEPQIDWIKVKMDTPIYVKDVQYGDWTKRKFAKFENGRIYAWTKGMDSWTAPDSNAMTDWNYVKLAEVDE